MQTKTQKTVSIQPRGLGLNLPYPFHIDSRGMVGAQEFWKGKPHKLIGFSERPIAGEMEVTFVDFWAEPKLAVSKFPVFQDKNGEWHTYTAMIESVRINR